MKEIESAWKKIAPFWPLQNIIACNPLQGFEDLEFSQALNEGISYFKQRSFEPQLDEINRISIKWFQTIFDDGFAVIKMPKNHKNIFLSWKDLAIFDQDLHKNSTVKKAQILALPDNHKDAILHCLKELRIDQKDHEEFLSLMLTTLSGWASYAKYLANWQKGANHQDEDEIRMQYLAIRLAITLVIYPQASQLLKWHQQNKTKSNSAFLLQKISKQEKQYQQELLENLQTNFLKEPSNIKTKIAAQIVFCIDVRSERIRSAIETIDNYQTFGFAGFFGVPAIIENETTQEKFSSCPVLLNPKHHVCERKTHNHQHIIAKERVKNFITKIYQSLKYNFSTPLVLAESVGILSGLLMVIRNFAPKFFVKFNHQNLIKKHSKLDISNIDLSSKVEYAKSALLAIDLSKDFADIVIFCGHGSQSENNAHASALDCGACGGNQGDGSARIIVAILNDLKVRKLLEKDHIEIPHNTVFIAAKHNTTTDEITLFDHHLLNPNQLQKLTQDFAAARNLNNIYRAQTMNFNNHKKAAEFIAKRSISWFQTRPEWGLAGNASFIIAKRQLTKDINLQGRSFLHSYNWQKDDGRILESIMTAPLIVAQWINSQYFFSTLDNMAFGSGSKVTQNIVGKIGIMQGNGSDLMNGLPLQSVFKNDRKKYHQPLRLTVIIESPKERIISIIAKHSELKKLFTNSWIHLFCFDEEEKKLLQLNSDLSWSDCNFSKKDSNKKQIWKSL